MALRRAVQGEKGRIVTLTAYKEGSTDVQNLTGTTLTGIIETSPGPSYTVREISGVLTLLVAADGTFTWVWDETDTGTAGKFLVQFIGTVGSSIIYKSFPEPWEVVRSPATPAP